MMVTNCSICDTEYGLLPGISFHRLPKVESRRERWITAIKKRITNFTPAANVFICSQHFSEDCFLPSPTGKRYLVPNAVPSIFDMRLRKKYKIQFDQQQLSIESHDAIASNTKLRGLEIATNIDQSTDNLHKPYVSILKVQHLTKSEIVNSTNLDKSANDEEARKSQEQLHKEKCDVITNIDHEKLNSEIATNIDENQDNLDQPCTSTFKQQHLTQFDILHRNIGITSSDKKVNNEAKELIRANTYIKKLTKKLNASQQKYKRLQEQATSLAFLVRQLQGEKNTTESLEEDCSDV
ncbi:uncharacterized protein [Linepithema humile]|uniref:uncharacterized protein n=1 Tax=Linepithema humile TaxID=83485 RepID=UPI00351F4A91